MIRMAKKKPARGRPSADQPRRNPIQLKLTDTEMEATEQYLATFEYPPEKSVAVRKVWLSFLTSKGFPVKMPDDPDA